MIDQTHTYSGGDGVAMPDADDDIFLAVIRDGTSIFGVAWWGLTSIILVTALMGAFVPWWLLLVASAELCVRTFLDCSLCSSVCCC